MLKNKSLQRIDENERFEVIVKNLYEIFNYLHNLNFK